MDPCGSDLAVKRRLISSLASAKRIALSLAVLALSGACTRPLSPSARVLAPEPKASPTWTWSDATDVERIERLYVTATALFGAGPAGLVSWDRASSRFRNEVGTEAPGMDVTAIAESTDGRIYAGLPGGLAWREATGPWQRVAEGQLASGVTALAPRAEGGVWVGTSGGLSYFDARGLHVVNERHRVRQFSVSPSGEVWAATDGFGVVRLGSEIVEHTTGEGVCGNRIRSVFAGAGGRVGVTCLETGARARFSLSEGQGFQTWALSDVPGVVQRVEPLIDAVEVHTDLGTWTLAPPTPRVAALAGPRAERSDEGRLAPPPLPEASGVRRATVPLLTADAGPRALRPTPRPLPSGLDVTATTTSPDGTVWFALAHHGVVGVREGARQRFVSSSLATAAGLSELVFDADGRGLAVADGQRLVRWTDGTWGAWPVTADPGIRVMAVAVDPQRRAWVVGRVEPLAGQATQVAIFRAEGQTFTEVARLPAPTLAGPLTVGDLAVDAAGRLVMSLFWTTAQGQRRGAGLGVVAATLDRIDVWAADDGLSDTPAQGEVKLPDAWVNCVATSPQGGVLLGTNSGLVQVDAEGVRVWGENENLPSEVVTDIAVAPSGRIYLVTAEGFGFIDAGVWTRARTAEAAAGPVDAVAVATDGRVWIGGQRGLFVGDARRFDAIDPSRGGFSFGSIARVVTDPRGGVWVVTPRGVVHGEPAR